MRAINLLTFFGILIHSFGIIRGNEAAFKAIESIEEDRGIIDVMDQCITGALRADFGEVWKTCRHIFSDIKLKNYWDEIKANFKEKSLVKSIMKQMKEDL